MRDLEKRGLGSRKGLVLLVMVVMLGVIVMAAAPEWNVSFPLNASHLEEDQSPVFTYNVSANVSDADGDSLTFSLTTGGEGNPIVSGIHGSQPASFFSWITLNSSTGILTINSTLDNQTGEYNISIDASDGTNSAGARTFHFIANATNDFPEFTNLNDTYNLTQDEEFFVYINASDEEEHYPLVFGINFTGCDLASFSTRENCTLFDFNSVDNTSASFNYTPVRNDAGTYFANISVMDAGGDYNCPYTYCSSDYSENKTTYHSVLVNFTVFSTLLVNVTDCQNAVFQEGEENTCQINISTQGPSDSLNISSLAILRNYEGSVSNTSWFYPTVQDNSSDFNYVVDINVTPGKTEIGNWTINFSVFDLTYSDNATEQIFVYVNRTANGNPAIEEISDVNFSTSQLSTINITAYDNDFLIPDKNVSFGGYNETLDFTLGVFNRSNLSQELNITGFDIEILSMPVSGTNRTEARIQFTPNSSDVGDYTINISIVDLESSYDETLFNMSIFGNNAPVWNSSIETTFVIYENNNTFLNLTQNVSDADGDSLTFSFTNSTSFDSFSLNSSSGIINFTSLDVDVGEHILNVTASDGFLEDVVELNFTVLNVNDAPVIQTPLSVTNATRDADSNINATEDNVTTITLQINDDDFRIPSNQVSFYNEELVLSLDIEGPNTNLFSFSLVSTNRNNGIVVYEAVFTPNKTDTGSYNVSLNVSDQSGSLDTLDFNLTIEEIEHDPVLDSIENQTSSVGRNLFLDINSTDSEDSEGAGLTYNYSFLQGDDFINEDESVFNTTTGVLNVTFNSSQGGIYRINISVTDNSSNVDYQDFYINVYDSPNITFPGSGNVFNLSENSTSVLTFNATHAVGDNLSYNLYINGSLRSSFNASGNGSFNVSITPNFTDETYGGYTNITLEAINAIFSDLNATMNWSTNITHANSPVSFDTTIGDSQAVVGSTISLELDDYFSDVDYSDSAYNQSLNFSVSRNSSSFDTGISFSLNGTTLLFTSSSEGTDQFNVTASDLNSTGSVLTTAESNDFEITFVSQTTVATTSSGGSSSRVVSLDLVLPDPQEVEQGQVLNEKVRLVNDGQTAFFNVVVTAQVMKGGVVSDGIKVTLNETEFSRISVSNEVSLGSIFEVKTGEPGRYDILFKVSSISPSYSKSGKMFLTIPNQRVDFNDRILFTEQLIAENPECIELTELLDRARELNDQGRVSESQSLLESVVQGCRNSISQRSYLSPPFERAIENQIFSYALIATIVSLVVIIAYYYYRRARIERAVKAYLRKL